MIIQKCVKGIGGGDDGITQTGAFDLIRKSIGIVANRWRNGHGTFSTADIATHLTETNLDRHIHDFPAYGGRTPFISLASGAVRRDTVAWDNEDYSAIDTALDFATDNWSRSGALVYCWVLTGVNAAVENHMVAESVRDLLIYRRWSRYQLEGEVTAKGWVPSNQIERVEWWDGSIDTRDPVATLWNPGYTEPARLSNLRDLF